MKQFQTQAAIATIPEPDTVTRTIASQEQAPGVMLGGTLAGSNSEMAYWDLIQVLGRNAPAEFRAVPCPSEEVVGILVIGDSSCAMVEEPNDKFPTKHHVAELLQAEQLRGSATFTTAWAGEKGLTLFIAPWRPKCDSSPRTTPRKASNSFPFRFTYCGEETMSSATMGTWDADGSMRNGSIVRKRAGRPRRNSQRFRGPACLNSLTSSRRLLGLDAFGTSLSSVTRTQRGLRPHLRLQ